MMPVSPTPGGGLNRSVTQAYARPSSSGSRSMFSGDKVPSGYKKGQLAQFTPEQMNLLQMLFGGSMGGIQSALQNLSGMAAGDEGMFSQMEAPALRQFSELQGNIASRFSGMGTGARRSSGFQNTMGAAGADLAERLQGNRMNLQQNAIQQLLGLSGSLLGQRPYDRFIVENPWLNAASSLGGSAAKIIGAKYGAGS